MSTLKKLMIGLASCGFPVLLAAFMVPQVLDICVNPDVLLAGGVSCAISFVVFVVVTIFNFIHAAQNEALSMNEKGFWIVAIGCFWFTPIYWYLHIWKRAAT